MNTDIAKIQEEVTGHLANKETLAALLATTFKGLTAQNVPKAIVEGMIRGFTFKDFLEKNIYAIPYGMGYSLVTSIDYARKLGMRSGVIGKSAPKFDSDKEGRPISCTITIKRSVGGSVGEFTETVYFNEYSTGKNLWLTKPRTMLAKVAEMHALRMACPEEMSQVYAEEEMEKEAKPIVVLNVADYREKLIGTKSLEELRSVWAGLPAEMKANPELGALKDDLKESFGVKPVAKTSSENEGNKV